MVLGGPEVGGGLGLAAAALGVVDGGASGVLLVAEPEGFAGGVADGLFDFGAGGGEAEGLAVGGVAEVEGVGLVAVEVGEGEGADGDGEGAEGLALAARQAREPDWRADMGRRLAAALSDRFSDEGRARRLADLVRPPPRRNATAVAENILEAPVFARSQATRGLIHLARPIIDRFRPPG